MTNDEMFDGDYGVFHVLYTANIFKVIFTVFNCVPISTVISLYGLHLIAAPTTVVKLITVFLLLLLYWN